MTATSAVDPLVRNHVVVTGRTDGPVLIFGHGLGGSADSWRYVAPAFEQTHRVVVFDHMGVGRSDLGAYDRVKYDSLHGYADDVLEILEALDARDAVFVGHSVGGMIGLLAANRRPDLIGRLVLLGPSPRYIDAPGYEGGFTQREIDDLLTAMESNYVSWSASLAPVLMGNPERPELAEGLARTFRASDPAIVSQFARVTFLSDNRRDLPEVTVPTLILQCRDDDIASTTVARYVHDAIPGSELVFIDATGHVPNLSAPEEVVARIRAFAS